MTAPMVVCRTCGASIARSAGTCPACGAHRTRVGNAVAIAGLIAVIIVLAVIVLYAVGHHA